MHACGPCAVPSFNTSIIFLYLNRSNIRPWSLFDLQWAVAKHAQITPKVSLLIETPHRKTASNPPCADPTRAACTHHPAAPCRRSFSRCWISFANKLVSRSSPCPCVIDPRHQSLPRRLTWISANCARFGTRRCLPSHDFLEPFRTGTHSRLDEDEVSDPDPDNWRVVTFIGHDTRSWLNGKPCRS